MKAFDPLQRQRSIRFPNVVSKEAPGWTGLLAGRRLCFRTGGSGLILLDSAPRLGYDSTPNESFPISGAVDADIAGVVRSRGRNFSRIAGRQLLMAVAVKPKDLWLMFGKRKRRDSPLPSVLVIFGSGAHC